MKEIHTVAVIKQEIDEIKKQGKSIGFVPTMGALHKGHLSLVERAKAENDVCVVSVFVNPTQFNNKEDLKKYPRDIDADVALLQENGCDVAFFPTAKEMYPEGEKSKQYDFGGLAQEMEGNFRPGHFEGVSTVVEKFFDIVLPDKAYFGEKDFQQLRIIQVLAQRKGFPEIIPMPIFREPDGLAMSSRNQRLSATFREEAPVIHQLLQKAKDWAKTHTPQETLEKVHSAFAKTSLKLEYFTFCDEETLKPIHSWSDSPNIRAFVAVYAGEIRLIDNMKII